MSSNLFLCLYVNIISHFQKPGYARWSTLAETGILLHVYVLTRFLTAANYLHRCAFSQVTQKHKQWRQRKSLTSVAMKKQSFVFDNERVKYTP